MEIMEDTIAAIATAVSEAGISIVRISGKQAIETDVYKRQCEGYVYRPCDICIECCRF